MHYEDIVRELNDAGVKYLIVGGMAVVFHGHIRFTCDLDLMLDLGGENLSRFVEAMKGLGYVPKVPVKAEEFIDPQKREKWIGEKNMRVFSFIDPKRHTHLIDVFVENPLDFGEAYKQRKVFRVGDLEFSVISLEGLKKLKLLSGREQDILDIKALENEG
jgi:hypothetical protein